MLINALIRSTTLTPSASAVLFVELVYLYRIGPDIMFEFDGG